MNRNVLTLSIAALVALAGGTANASLIGDQVDITVTLGFADLPESDRVFQDLGVLVDGSVELTLEDEISNPNSFKGYVEVDVDGAANQIIVTGFRQQFVGDYDEIEIWIDDLDWIGAPGQIVDAFVLSDLLLDGSHTLDVTFTSDSIHIFWGSSSGFFELIDGGQAVIGFEASHVIPEPATMTLMGLGLAGFALRRKMKA